MCIRYYYYVTCIARTSSTDFFSACALRTAYAQDSVCKSEGGREGGGKEDHQQS